jgi:hypothetical protein
MRLNLIAVFSLLMLFPATSWGQTGKSAEKSKVAVIDFAVKGDVGINLIASCQRHNVEPFAYLRDVLTRIASHPHNRLAELLPERWKPVTAA